MRYARERQTGPKLIVLQLMFNTGSFLSTRILCLIGAAGTQRPQTWFVVWSIDVGQKQSLQVRNLLDTRQEELNCLHFKLLINKPQYLT